MLAKFTTCGVGFLVAIAIFVGLTALARSQFREYVPQPAVRVLRSVPLVAEVNGIRMPITVDMALRIGLSQPVTSTAKMGGDMDPFDSQSTQPAADTGTTGASAASIVDADYLVDELGTPYDVRIEPEKGLELLEWHANGGSANDITFNAAFRGDMVGQWVTFDVTYYDELGRSLAGVMNSTKTSVYNPISKQTLFEFTCEGCMDALSDAEFYSVVIR